MRGLDLRCRMFSWSGPRAVELADAIMASWTWSGVKGGRSDPVYAA